MKKVTFLFINFFLLFFILVPNTFSGPIMCNGELTNKTAKATGHLLVAFGFAYTAIGFQEAEEPNKIMFLRDTITPLTSARTAEKYFNTFLTEKLPLKLQSLDSLAKKTNYKN